MNDGLFDRRELLMFGGATMTLAFSGGCLRAADAIGRPLPAGDAYAPWQLWNDASIEGTPLALVAAATLAASPHNTQPWLFRVREDAIEILADLSRNLGTMDAYVREMYLGLGCATQNMVLAAAPNGYSVDIDVVSGSLTTLNERRAPMLAVTLRLTKSARVAPDALYPAIPNRHTNRYAYNRSRGLPADWLEFVPHAAPADGVRVFLFTDGEERRIFYSAVIAATEAIIADQQMNADSDRWFRSSSAEIDTHRDGPTLAAAGLSPLTMMLARVFPASPKTIHEKWLSQTRETQIATAPVVGLIAVRDRYDRAGAIAAGRTWQRKQLSAATRGIAMQPLNQPIEMVDREREMGRGTLWAERMSRLTGNDWQATFSFRAGFADEIAPASPRRRLKDILVA